ncbi:hypothetical protein PBRA_009286 [Plasmodiophora brassicae]|uniref:Phosphatidate cytidylyltransferase, mitochondrial n=1 Tax=Plasmodiophora brassicae TaxID=37360 RepID=A0A0G4J634_PLABS|nr:hypothetical protein PBRA_009286 [Plasmodiophora brassicae]
MVDFIFGRGARSPCPAMRLLIAFASGVRDSPSWHADNMDQHPRHYSCLARLLGPGGVSRMQRTAAGVHFNTLVPYDERTMIKYGVIAVEDLVHDLRTWSTLYVSGRMQKPQTILASTDEIDRWSACNLRQAFLSALVMQPARFTEHDLFMTIAGLSYSGDIRMHIGRRARIMMCASRVFTVPPDPGMGENPRKVANIVNVNRDGFRRLYAPCFEYADRLGYLRPEADGSRFQRVLDLHHLCGMFARLPDHLRDLCFRECRAVGDATQAASWRHALVSVESAARVLRRCIGRIGQRASFWQTLKGVYSAGVAKSIQYAYRKVAKSRQT